jgi:FkbM family methyltransferase
MQIIKAAGLIFECEDDIEVMRAQTLLTKEPGTIAWLDAEVRAGEILWDVGANIGPYSLYAISKGAAVVAFEPHVANARSLFRNLRANQMSKAAVVVTSPLSDKDGLVPFYYAAAAPGSSGSQLAEPVAEDGGLFTPAAQELKYAITGDAVAVATGEPPTLVKIDVDGRELHVLVGMVGLFHYRPPRSLQVEIHAATNETIVAFLERLGYRLDHRHHTSRGAKLIAKGADPMSVPHNAVFVR